MTNKRINLSGDSEAILREHVVTIIENPNMGWRNCVDVDYEDLAKILVQGYQPSGVPEELL